MVANPPPSARSRRRIRLWPLLLLPFVGMPIGYFLATQHVRSPFWYGPLSVAEGVFLGAALGWGFSTAVASAVLAYRIARLRFTISAMLIMIAAVAILLWLARMVAS